MNFLLKIVEGPNKGAEIALVEGVAVTIGQTDACDIVLADRTLGDEPIKIEATAVGVTLDGERLEPLHVALRGSTAFAVGPADAVWGTLVWPTPPRVAKEEGPETPDEGRAAPRPPEAPEPPTASEPPAKRRGSCLGCLVAFVLFVLVLVVLGWFFRDRACPCVEKVWRMASGGAGESETSGVSTNEALPALKARLGLAETNRHGRAVLVGNFATRAERLTATAEAYAARPGIDLDFADGESLKTAVADTLALVGETALNVKAVTNRVAVLVGTPMNLRRTLEALSADVPKLANVDVAGVVLARGVPPPHKAPPHTASPTKAAAPAAPAAPTLPAPTLPASAALVPSVVGEGTAHPAALPVCGILTKPYPCLVLKSGARVLEGGTIGDLTILKIEADTVTVTNKMGRFTWKP